jgi:lipopolysaccharide export system permease protein
VLIFRYLAKEVFTTLIALTAILLLIFMSNQFVQYLNRAASGRIPVMLVMKLMMLELPNMMGLLLPLGFYIALLVAYGRLYAESEMTVMQACGYGPRQLLQHSFIMATVVTVVVAGLMIWASPIISTERSILLRTTGIQTIIQTIVPGRFHAISGGKDVFYVAAMNREHTQAKHIFLARLVEKEGKGKEWSVVWADTAFAETEPHTYEDYLILKDGKAYQGLPGHADYQIAEFGRYKVRLPHPTAEIKSDLHTASTASLWPITNSNLNKAVELQWRLSVPLMVLTLTMVGVPLSRVNPRSGKFARLLPAIVLYIVYANFMFVARDWLLSGKIPIWVGMWWLHALVALVGLLLFYRNQVKLS